MKHLISTILGFLICTFLNGQVFESAELARQKAAVENKPVLLYFSGSDWCPNCLRFEKNILSDPLFMAFVRDNVVMLRADFPQRKKLSAELIAQNEKLAEKYNSQGTFPSFVLFRTDHSQFRRINFTNQDTAEFISLLKENIKSILTGE